MNQLFYPLLSLLMQSFLPRHNARLQLLLVQIRVLRSRLDSERIVPTPEEKAESLRWGAACDHNVQDVLKIVEQATYRRWLRQMRKDRPFKKSGRPRIAEEIRELILRMARGNVFWGYRRIVGELKKLGIRVGSTSVKRILREFGIFPDPEKAKKKPPLPWSTFIQAHIDSMVGCDFFSKPIWTPLGKREAYSLMFIHLATRKVYCSKSTYHPDGEWVMQQARNVSMWLDDLGAELRFLIRDRDGKFPNRFDDFWAAQGAQVIRIPPRSPQANSFSESWIGSLKRECLNFFICFNRRQLDHIVRTWVGHYNSRRPHRGHGIDNNVLDADFRPNKHGPVQCEKKLGGIIKSYYRDAA